MKFLKKLASYFYPITVKSIPSERSGVIELTLVNGKLLMDSKTANYSYGNLQKVLKKGLLHIGKKRLQELESILVLGVAGGSVIKTLRNDFKLTSPITGVEIDSDVLALANSYFQLHDIDNLTLVDANAFTYLNNCKKHYDLIIVDIFNDSEMPIELFDVSLWSTVHQLLSKNGICLFNTIANSKESTTRNLHLKQQIHPLFSTVKTLKTHQINELFILNK